MPAQKKVRKFPYRNPPKPTIGHLSGDALITYVRMVSRSKNHVPGALYIIGGREVRI